MEVLADVEHLEVDEVLKAVRECPDAVQASVEGTQRRHVGGGEREAGELVGVDGELAEAVELEPQRVRQPRQLVEVGVQLLQRTASMPTSHKGYHTNPLQMLFLSEMKWE